MGALMSLLSPRRRKEEKGSRGSEDISPLAARRGKGLDYPQLKSTDGHQRSQHSRSPNEPMHIYPWEVISIIVLVVALVYFRRKQNPQPTRDPVTGRRAAAKKVEQTTEEAYMALRRQAIETDPKRLGRPGELKPAAAFGALIALAI